MNSKLTIEVDIQEESQKAKNMMNQIRKIVDDHKGAELSYGTYNSVVSKIEDKKKYFEKHNFPPMCCVITMYGVALTKTESRQVILAQNTIITSNYKF